MFCYLILSELVDPDTNQMIKYANGDVAYWDGTLCDRDPINSCQPNPCVGKPGVDYDELHGQVPGGTCRDQVSG